MLKASYDLPCSVFGFGSCGPGIMRPPGGGLLTVW